MPKVGMEDIRKSAIIQATIEAIHEHGYAKTTMAEISRRAGVSTGLPHHYFGSKDALLNATMISLLKDLRQQARDRLDGSKSPRERILAIVQVNFTEMQFTAPVISAWLAFYVLARTDPRTRRLLTIYHRRLISNLLAEYSKLGDKASAEMAARGTAALIDGLWLQCALTSNSPADGPAKALVQDYVEKCLDSFSTIKTLT
ncbi:transcriptional regulator BetI [Rhodobacteraceae bacterium RKSG542]|uniref:transcriptional regulator BetI n=1 Tax=Pseudovibrio flavus TaxID=2529854 RepID=UPI0012BC12EC|nr:transcriptional regulator BetI [Pseudovibrio flavus]MTI18949.1 transcriptional regulator BetI [Pseudovibrio flavus]